MSYYKAINSGNADTLAIWNVWNGAAWVAAGSLPTTTDDVYTNNYIVTVTTSQSYLSWNRSSVGAPHNITQGGQFQIDGANEITIQGVINGTNVAQTAGSPLSACVNRLVTHTNTLHQIGNILGGYNTFTYGFFNNSTYDIDLLGDQIGGNTFSKGFYNNANATFTSIIGNQIGALPTVSSGQSDGFYNTAAATFALIIGNQIGGAISNSYGFNNAGAATFTTIVGNQVGSGAIGFLNGGAATFTNPIVGNQIASANYGFSNGVNGLVISFRGNAYASAGYAAIYNNTTSSIIYEGNIYNVSGRLAIWSQTLFLNITPTTVWEFSDFGGNSQYLYGAGSNTGMPPEDKVEDGYIYGANDEFEGTLVQPPFTIADFIAALKADDLGIRLGKCATTEEVDMTVAAYNS